MQTVMLIIGILVILAGAAGLPIPTTYGHHNAAPTTPAPVPISPFGLNMYITGAERTDEEAQRLITLATQVGAQWTREEIAWASWGKKPQNTFYDQRIMMLSNAGIGIIGMLLTTPSDYRSPACKAYASEHNQPAYWCAPTDPYAYADWAAMVVERYDADGVDDAPGSPRVDAWEIWNEPDQDKTWLPQADPAAYAVMLRASYDAIKAADPTALVLNGGVMTFDTVGVGSFMEQVVAHAGWDSFDVLSLHPWLIDHAPDEPTLINPRENFDVTIPGRIAMAQDWIDSHGGGKPIWITEVGWSTCGDRCEPQFAKNEDQQANYMVRTFVLAAATGVPHVSYFQLEDKFDGEQIPWSQAAILNNDLSPKPAYGAYGVMVTQLQHAQYAGTGSLHQPGVLANYRFTLANGGKVDVLWGFGDNHTVSFPLETGLDATLVQRDGASQPLAAGGSAEITVGEQPVYIRQTREETRFFAETGYTLRGRFLSYWQHHGDLAILGIPISEERNETGSDGRTYRVQWLERARMEHHPENPPPHDVLMGLLGVDVLQQRGIDWQTLPTVKEAPQSDCRYFPETRHSLCPPFLAYWKQHGGLPVFGFPISEPMDEQSADDGQVYTVQYFERNRFEHHPENTPPYDVLLGRLGAELMP